MDDKKKKYTKPEANVIDFEGEDIVTVSVVDAEATWGDGTQENW